MRRSYVDIPAGQMHYRHASGGGKAIILLHMSGSSSDEYEDTGGVLADWGLNVYAIDLLGFGSSDKPARYYSMTDHACTVVDFMDAVGIDSAVIYGNLATANMAVDIALLAPARVSLLLLAHPLCSTDPVQYAKKRDLPEYQVIVPQEDGSHLMELWRRSKKYDELPYICDLRCRNLHSAGEFGETLHWALFEDKPLASTLPRVKQKTIIIIYDIFGDSSALRNLVTMLPHCTIDNYLGGSPYISRSHPEQVAEMIEKHLALCFTDN